MVGMVVAMVIISFQLLIAIATANTIQTPGYVSGKKAMKPTLTSGLDLPL